MPVRHFQRLPGGHHSSTRSSRSRSPVDTYIPRSSAGRIPMDYNHPKTVDDVASAPHSLKERLDWKPKVSLAQDLACLVTAGAACSAVYLMAPQPGLSMRCDLHMETYEPTYLYMHACMTARVPDCFSQGTQSHVWPLTYSI